MSKAVGAVAAVVVVAGVAWAGTAWYTGSQIEQKLLSSIEKANAQLNAAAPDLDANVRLISFEKGMFSSNARYSLSMPASGVETPNGAKPSTARREVIILDHIEHGPFPMSRLKSMHFGPVMATSNFVLERSPDAEGWFKATKDVAPLSGHANIAYSGDADGLIRLEPVNYESGTDGVTFTGLDLNFDVSDKGESSKLDGAIDALTFKTVDEEGKPATFDAKTIAINSDMTRMYLGHNEVTIKQFAVSVPDAKVLVTDYAQRMNLKETDKKISGTLGYDIGQVNINGKDVASGQFNLNVKNLDSEAVQKISDLYRAAAMRDAQSGDPEGVPEATEEEQKAFMAALTQLLAGNPSIAIDPLLVKTTKGEARLNVAVDLMKPEGPAMTMDAITAQMVRSLDARLVVAKPVLVEGLAYKATNEGVDPAKATQDATAQADMIASLGVQMGAAKIDGDNLVSTLKYSAGQVDFNGKKMPIEAFGSAIFGMIIGGSMGMNQSEVPPKP